MIKIASIKFICKDYLNKYAMDFDFDSINDSIKNLQVTIPEEYYPYATAGSTVLGGIAGVSAANKLIPKDYQNKNKNTTTLLKGLAGGLGALSGNTIATSLVRPEYNIFTDKITAGTAAAALATGADPISAVIAGTTATAIAKGR